MSSSETGCRLPRPVVAARLGWVLAGSVLGCAGVGDGAPAALPVPAPDRPAGGAGSFAAPIELTLVAETKLSRLLDDHDISHFEASGVVARDGTLFVASDNLQRIGAIGAELGAGSWGPGALADSQYEAITSSDDGRFFLVVESPAGTRAKIVTLDASTAPASESWTDVSFDHDDGFEGLAWLRAAGVEYLLALCENNACRDGDTPPGQGRIQRLSLVDGVWSSQLRLELPPEVRFRNYSDLALLPNADGSYVAAVVSRQSSALWLGRLTLEPWALTGPSSFYSFPRGPSGEVQYCTLEGVTFLGPRRLALVSDKSDGQAPCNRKDESLHIFDLPGDTP